MKVPEKTVQRLVLYRKILQGLLKENQQTIFSHLLGKYVDSTPAQVRRDLMYIGYKGTPAHGYAIADLIRSISQFIDTKDRRKVCIVGLGNLGRAIIDYCYKRNPKLSISIAFEKSPSKIGKTVSECLCYDINELENVIKAEKIELAILAIPELEAQPVSERLVRAGIKGILNYSPVELRLPNNIYVENRDMLLALEKVAFFVS
jgi:redox-sensing transcriptional repressor